MSHTATILVTDLVGSTALMSRIGDEHAERLRRVHDRLSRTAVETHGGFVVKGMGDGVMATFGEASGALSAAVAIQQAAQAQTLRNPDLPLVLRMGMSAGDITVDGGDCFGTPVVEAARLCNAADGGQILAADVVRLMVKGRGQHRFNSVGEQTLKGLAESVVTVEVEWATPAETERLPFPALLDVAGDMGFAGRMKELELLDVAWQRATAGEPGSVLVAGEPGVGKTRLAAEASRSIHAAGGAVLYGRCQEGLGVPFEPIVEVLNFFAERTSPGELPSRLGRHPGELVRLLPELAELVPGLDEPLRSDPETEQYRLFQAVASWLTAAAEPAGLVLVIDDLHWAALPTFLLLTHVLRAAESARLLVIGIYRDTDIDSEHPMTAMLTDMRRMDGSERFTLSGLTVEELTVLMEDAPRGQASRALARALFEETAGNPFYCGELLRHGTDSEAGFDASAVPEGVRDVILSRVQRLSPPARDILGVAAVLGRDVDVTALATVSGFTTDVTLDALDEAVPARLVEETAVGVYRFVHALVRSALDSTVSATRKAQFHLRASHVFENEPTQQARHLLACAPLGGETATAAACLAAGDRALAVLADAEAAEWYRQGLPFVSEGTPPHIDLLTGIGETQRRTGNGDSRQTLFEAARLAVSVGDVRRVVRAVIATNRGFSSAIGDVDHELLELVADALQLAGPEPTAERAELLSLQALELHFTGDHRRVADAADEAVAIADALPDIVVKARVGIRRLYACLLPDRYATLADEADVLTTYADATGDPQLRVFARRPSALFTVGALNAAHERMKEAAAIADQTGQPGLRSRALFDYGTTLDALGHHEEAQELAQVALELGQQAAWADTLQFYAGRMAEHWAYGGEPDTMVTVLTQAITLSPGVVAWKSGIALALAFSGRDTELAELLQDGPRILNEIPMDQFWLVAHMLLSLALGFGVEDPICAAILYDRLLPYRLLHACNGVGYWGPVEMSLAVTARTLGDLDTAVAHHASAAQAIDACGTARPRAINGYQWAKTLLARQGEGDLQRAIELLRETHIYSQAKGYVTFVSKTEELLATLD
ncbi:MAG TPA: AAA family ATPase [Acidimicrobiales bacterium]|nr:AAA family ATPase [Acidimicrobiales bacterium]